MKVRLRPGSVARAEDLVTACVRECAGYLTALDGLGGTLVPERAKLVSAIGTLVAEHAAYEPSPDRSFDALLNVGRIALDAGEVRLARRVADAGVALRSRSQDAWRLRAQALAADGREADSVHAHGRSDALAGRRPGTSASRRSAPRSPAARSASSPTARRSPPVTWAGS